MRDSFCCFCPRLGECLECFAPSHEECPYPELLQWGYEWFEKSITRLKRNLAALEKFLKTGCIDWTTEYFSIAGNTTHCTLMLTPLGAEVLREIVRELEERGEDVSFLKELCEKRRFEGDMTEEILVYARLFAFVDEIKNVRDTLSRVFDALKIDRSIAERIFESGLIGVGGLVDTFNFLAEKLGFKDRLSFERRDTSWEIKGIIGDSKIGISGNILDIYQLDSFLDRMSRRAGDMMVEAGRRCMTPR